MAFYRTQGAVGMRNNQPVMQREVALAPLQKLISTTEAPPISIDNGLTAAPVSPMADSTTL